MNGSKSAMACGILAVYRQTLACPSLDGLGQAAGKCSLNALWPIRRLLLGQVVGARRGPGLFVHLGVAVEPGVEGMSAVEGLHVELVRNLDGAGCLLQVGDVVPEVAEEGLIVSVLLVLGHDKVVVGLLEGKVAGSLGSVISEVRKLPTHASDMI